MIDFERRRGMRPWELPLAQYLGRLPVLDDPVTKYEMQILKAALGAATLAHADPLTLTAASDADPTLRFAFHRGVATHEITVHDPVTGEILGGCISGLPYVRPQHRGRGIGAEIVYVADMATVRILDPISYSVTGLAGRVGAHRRHVNRALMRGDFVPEEVLFDYVRVGDTLSLSAPWTIARHRTACAPLPRPVPQQRARATGISPHCTAFDADTWLKTLMETTP